MDRERFQRLEQLLQAALELTPERRAAFADQACAGDASLKDELLQLLAAGPGTEALRDGILDAVGAFALGVPSGSPPEIPGYRMVRRLGAGGMGVVYEAFDQDLRRSLAIKVLHDQVGSGADAAPTPPEARVLARFLDEAQVTGQLDHPGVVPVYELGKDPGARPYFAMRLVAGRTAAEVFALAREQREGWTLTRALEVVLKVCDTMAYAHDKGVVHRDLKPHNVMVGRFGEVYVMDWGLARVLGQDDPRDLRLRGDGDRSADAPEGQPADSGSLVTRDGTILGTPSYMSPEQAEGRLHELDAHSDVYAAGACLYTLLTGRQPYVEPDQRPSALTVLGRVRAGPPAAIHELDRSIPAELVAVCDKAMARHRGGRYATMQELADDLRAFLGGRVVRAHRTGAWVELRKWVQRNRGMAAALFATFLTAVAGAAGIGVYALRADENARLADRKSREATDNLDRFLELADVVTHKDLLAEADALWPEVPEKAAAMTDWLRRARELAGHLPAIEQARQEVAARGQALGPEEQAAVRRSHPKAAELAGWRTRLEARTKVLEERRAGRRTGPDEATDQDGDQLIEAEIHGAQAAIAALSGEVEATTGLRFAAPGDRFLFDALARLALDLRALADPERGAIASVEKRREWAATVRERTLVQERGAWDRAIASIADRTQCPPYQGLALAPQLGFVPLDRDKDSGLWEFWQPRTGARPERDASGRLVVGDETGLVFVLLPGGKFAMGAQGRNRQGPNYDAQATVWQGPVHTVELEPFFLAKHEMTQGQWQRLTGTNPSYYRPGASTRSVQVTLRHPVESVSKDACVETLRRAGLVLPTEAQWEHACRAGRSTPWHTGDTVESLQGFANIADEGSKAAFAPGWRYEKGLDDGFGSHAPVGTFRPNAFGLHDMHGNVWEWCRDEFGDYRRTPHPGDGARDGDGTGTHEYRGGSFNTLALLARSSGRAGRARGDYLHFSLGCRPALAIQQ